METNRIYNENCLGTMKRMPDGFIDLTVTSPPYDDLREYCGCEWNLQIFQQVAQELYRVIKPGGVVVWVVGDKTENGSETLTSSKQKIYFRENCGFNIHDTMIYKSEKPPLAHNRYEQKFEYMFVLSKGRPRTFNPNLLVKLKHPGKPLRMFSAVGAALSWEPLARRDALAFN
jgi:site-specific DNA-methyltransferase (adenine-specific)